MFFWRRDSRSGDAWITFSVLFVIGALAALALAATAGAATSDVIAPSDPQNPQTNSGWQAGTCKKEPAITDATAADFCNVKSNAGEFFFEETAAHPNFGFTQFIVAHTTKEVPLLGTLEEPTNELAMVRVDLPVGLAVNPGATERCPIATFEAGASGCPAGSKVGESGVTASEPLVGLPIAPIPGVTAVSVYNVVPKEGQAARFGLELAGNEVFLEGDIDSTGDYHEGFTIAVPHALPVQGVEGAILKNRLVFNGRAGEGTGGDGTFLTTPSTCNGEYFTQSGSQYSTFLKAASYAEIEAGESFPAGAGTPLESPIPPGTSPKGCNTIPYTPGLAVNPGTTETNSPAAAEVAVAVPHIAGGANREQSTTKEATVTLPPGMGINPSAAAAPNNLKACENGQFVLHSAQPITCPAESRIGSARITTAALPEGNLEGPVYIAKQEGNDPASGNLYRIFIDAGSTRYGVDVRLVGHVSANPLTGQLTTRVAEIPQVPFTDFTLSFVGGQKAVLSSPPTCAPSTAAAQMTPWSGNPAATPTSTFSLHATPGGGACAATLAARPFAPSFQAAPQSSNAGAYSPLHVQLTRTNGQQELKAVNVTLAPGLIAKVAGTPYCPASAIAAAAGTSGAAQTAQSSCPSKSEIGTATVQAGTGATPLQITGKVFLAGPYNGAPLSLAVITPATAGPFDLGTVVVRVALQINPETAQVTAVSDAIPDVFGGAQLSIRSIALDLTKKDFTLNPTNCSKLTTTAAIRGGGGDPTSPAAWSTVNASVPFQATNCGALDFKPSLNIKFFGKKKTTRRAGHPRLQATLTARPGDANLEQAVVTLPKSELIDQSHIRTICTRVQLAANDCPAGAIYGYATAESPLIAEPLSGPVYLTSSNHTLPDLLADLHGQVNIRLRGVITSNKKHRIVTTFAGIPDVPVSTFKLTMQGGKKSLLVNSKNICAKRFFSRFVFSSQNGKQLIKKRSKLQVAACPKVKKHVKKHKAKGKKRSKRSA
jgi:hypothetical protein